MRKSNVLATVSFVALSTGLAFTAAQADTNPNLRLDWALHSNVIDPNSVAAVPLTSQTNEGGSVTAVILNTFIGEPLYPALTNYGSGGGDVILVETNITSSTAIGNNALTFLDPMVVTGSGATSAGIATSNQANFKSVDIVASVNTIDIGAASQDLGLGSSQTVDGNTISASGSGNITKNSIEGDVNVALTSTEAGQAQLAQANNKYAESSATLLVASAQTNDDIDNAKAIAVDTRIGSLVVAVADPDIAGTPISVQDNTIQAIFTGNNANNLLDLDDDIDVKQASDVALDGTIGIATAQRNAGDLTSFQATVTKSDIEAGDTASGTAISDLNGSSIDFEGNDIVAKVTGNTATSALHVDAIDINGDTLGLLGTAVQDHVALTNAGGADGHTLAIGDVFVASYQFNDAVTNAQVGNTKGDADDGDLTVLVEDIGGSTVDALNNSISSSAKGNVVDNSIDLENITSFSGLTALSSLQNTDSGNKQTASTNGDLLVSAATLGTSEGIIDTSTITADSNTLSSEAITNTGTNTISIDANSVTGATVNPDEKNDGFMTRSWRSNMVSSATTDIGLVSLQHTEDATVTSKTTGSILVDAADVGGAIGSEVITAAISASSNTVSALTSGNVIEDNSITVVDATTFAASVGLVSTQVVQDNAGGNILDISASVAPTDDAADLAIIQINSSALDTSAAKFDADGNKISAEVFGNLVNGDTNSILISGVTVGDNDMGSRTAGVTAANLVNIGAVEAVVDREVRDDDLPQTTVNSGFSLISDQSFEDPIKSPVKASVTGDFVVVNVGSADADATLSNTDVSASLNKVTGSVAANTASNAIDVDAITLNANTSLVNTQSFWDEELQGDGTGSIDVDVTGDILVNVDSGATVISDLNAEVSDNTVLASGRLSNAVNKVDVSAQTQVVTNIIAGADIDGVIIDSSVNRVRAETGLINDQDFNGLIGVGLSVALNGTDALVTVDTNDGSLVGSKIDADGNTFRAQALANEASSTLNLTVQTFDISKADTTGAADANGPLAVISNAQRGSDAQEALYTGTVNALTNSVDIGSNIAGIDNAVDGVNVSADANSVSALARVNNGSNVLNVAGQTYEELVVSTPAIEAQGIPGGGQAAAEDLAFGIASYQLNGYDVSSTVEAGTIFVDAEGPSTIDGTNLTVDGNQLIAQARSNDISNNATVDFVTNNVSAFVVNVQEPGTAGLKIDAEASDNSLYIVADSAGGSTAQTSHASLDDNAIAALASGNRALINTLTIDGTNAFSGSGSTTPSSSIDPSNVAVADVAARVDAGIVNVQGASAVVSPQDELVTATVKNNSFNSTFDVFNTGSVSIDNNLVLGQGVISSANNLLGIGVEHKYAADGKLVITDLENIANVDGVTAAVVSQQLAADGSGVTVLVDDTLLYAYFDDVASTGAVAASVSGNDISAIGIGATVLNRLDVIAGANIEGVVGTPTPVMGDLSIGNPLTVNADFSILNYQGGEPEVATDVNGTNILINAQSKYDGDAVTMEGNAVTSSSTGFSATNALVLNAGGVGASSDVTGNVANRQDIDDTTVSSGVDVVDMRIFSESDLTSGANNSSVSILDNEVAATTNGNTALNAISTSAGATLQESSGAGVSITPAGPTSIAVTNSDYSVLNWQSFDDSSATSDIGDVEIAINDFAGTTGVDNSALNVSDNSVIARTTANNATNSLALNTGTYQHPSAVVANLQTTSGATISSSVDGVTIGIGATGNLIGDGVGAVSANSSFTVRGNQVGSIAIGNNASSSITGN